MNFILTVEAIRHVILSGTKWSRRIFAHTIQHSKNKNAQILRLAMLAQDDIGLICAMIRLSVVGACHTGHGDAKLSQIFTHLAGGLILKGQLTE